MKKILEVKKVSVTLNRKKIIDSVSFDVQKGELISLIGLNGTGKSTLLKAIMGLVPISSGTVKKHTDKIFYVPQKHDVDASFPITTDDFFHLFGDPSSPEVIEEMGLNKNMHQKISELSGGEFQRLLIAVALSHKPELLLLDEPTTGIDAHGEESFYELITELRKKHQIAIILVSHNIHLVIKNADKVLCLAGHICCTGIPEQVTEDAIFKQVFGKHIKPYIHHHDHHH